MFFSEWLSTYTSLLVERGLSNKTIYNKKIWLDRLDEKFGHRMLHNIQTSELHQIIRAKALESHASAAKTAHSVISDIFSEACSFGLITHNPAAPIRSPRTSPQRSRLNLNEWLRIFRAASVHGFQYTYLSMLLALITGQRRGDIQKMSSDNIRDGYLFVEQEKTGAKVALPLSLHLDAIGTSLNDVIRISPASGNILRFDCGRAATTAALTVGFMRARRLAYPDNYWQGNPPSFHEQRSLSERLYRSQGVNTMRLLGHKSQYTTDKYHDSRGRDWVFVDQ
ncbi:tyrosine-type recombinase/integrase [Erwinia sp. 9145]|uniref:tyrosine-type recombinase/integrase n=1 Tax=Erwinia sp. 9145 TaxID=1500895 RepID=UPI0006901D81|nr:tyrosine-type recombinase/integrase [Erwinia sp. 9145]